MRHVPRVAQCDAPRLLNHETMGKQKQKKKKSGNTFVKRWRAVENNRLYPKQTDVTFLINAVSQALRKIYHFGCTELTE